MDRSVNHEITPGPSTDDWVTPSDCGRPPNATPYQPFSIEASPRPAPPSIGMYFEMLKARFGIARNIAQFLKRTT